MDSRNFLINDVSGSVRDNLIGYVGLYPFLRLLDNCNVIVREDVNEIISSQVALISGGGSGHEPSHACFVGPGMLTASVHGNIFSSPNVNEILNTIRFIQKKDSKGVMMIIPNYTGDRLNFGLAKEKALQEGYKVEIIFFGDDEAFQGENSKAGKRGLAGIFFLHKIAGALANAGQELNFIKNEIENVAKGISTITLAASGCTIPGVGKSFSLPSDKLEIGLGIHGERGIKRINYKNVKEIISIAMQYLIGEHSCFYSSVKNLEKDNPEIALLINNLGGLSSMEINIISKEVLEYLIEFNIKRVYIGSFVSSFDMAGVSISIMTVTESILTLLDDTCLTPILSINRSMNFKPNRNIYVPCKKNIDTPIVYYDIISNRQLFLNCVQNSCENIIKNETYLNQLDHESGDSDCGTSLATGAKELMKFLHEDVLNASFLQISHILDCVMGGTSGAIYSLLFTGVSNYFSKFNNPDQFDLLHVQFWSELFKEAIEMISRYSYALPGDRTMLDPLYSIYLILRDCSDKYATPLLLDKIIKAAHQSALDTASMKAKAGRASYVIESCINKPDPGAWAVYIWIEATCSQIKLAMNGEKHEY